ncbi:MAG: tRNA (adenosine(37)-N6)-dimethylallyltransferase MiaA [Actinomycetota bacterium]|nr:tRNA (adenosine(37)-N6)-dimethylallyltransferase MiaA [Actinomycetota bacterium]
MQQIAIVAPTASGKSDVAMAVARAAGAHIVAVDAMQVYRGMDIGTAKPTAADRASVPHHCIDLVNPDERFSVAEYKQHAALARSAIATAGAHAVFVAGTGLYLTAVIDDLQLPGEWPAVRAELQAEPDVAVLFARLETLDPLAASRSDKSNRRRIERALEVCIGSGQPFSSFGPGTGAYPPSDVQQIGIAWPRKTLSQRIEHRVHTMMEAGFLAEARGLVERCTLSREAKQALGYRELLAHLAGELSLDEAVAQMVLHTRQFAVRQERWFRRDPRITWVAVESDPVAEVTPQVLALLR